jgi:hypothetical protein
MCLTIRLPVSRPLVSALASAFLRRPRRNSADLTGHRARETPNCFPAKNSHQHLLAFRPDTPSRFAKILTPPLGGVLTLRSASSSASVSPHGYRLLVLDDIVEECLCPLQLEAIYGLRSFSCILETGSQKSAARAGRSAGGYLSGRVSDHGGGGEGLMEGGRNLEFKLKLKLCESAWRNTLV